MKERFERMEDKHLAQMKEMQDKVISMERAQSQPATRTFLPKTNWQRKAPNHEQRPPHQLEAANMVEPYTPFCRACKAFHEESSCHYACYVQEHGFPEGCGPKASSSEPAYINHVGDMHNIFKKVGERQNNIQENLITLT